MKGIRISIGNSMLFVDSPLLTLDFKEKIEYKLYENIEMSCIFVDYSPKVFRILRRFWNIRSEEYLDSLGPEQFISKYNG